MEAINENRIKELITMIVPIITSILGSVAVNILLKDSFIGMSGRIKRSFGCSYGICLISLFLCMIVTGEFTFTLVIAAVISSVCFAVIPSLVISVIFGIVRVGLNQPR